MAKQQSITSSTINASAFQFLTDLKQNNNRDWFANHKEVYQKELSNIEAFANALLQQMNKHDVIETATGKKSLHRIYRDTRFSLDKTPYKTNWSGSFRRATKYRRGGYYFHIEPGNTFVAGGFFDPSPADLKLIRDDIAFDATPLRKVLNDEAFITTFQKLRGETVKTSPKGFTADHEAIDLLRYKQFLLKCTFSDADVLSANFLDRANQVYINMRPFLDYMSDVLSTDINGERI
jgi:uncharacterized protein (TIGR02453 family)